MNHSGDANKMVETPRTDAEECEMFIGVSTFTSGDVQQAFDFARQLERELNAANQRIQRLEDWKEWALAVEREWNANAIATMLGGQPGESQREVIQREVPKLLERIKRLEEESESDWHLAQSAIGSCAEMSSRIQRLEEAGDALKAAGYFGGFGDAVNKWIKAKEDKP